MKANVFLKKGTAFILSYLFFTMTSIAQICLGGTITTTNGESIVFTCPGDGIPDVIEFSNNSNTNSNYAYVVTDANENILAFPEGNAVNFEEAGVGECHVWGLAYTGNLIAEAGDHIFGLAFSDDCFSLSSTRVTVYRQTVSGGEVRTISGAETAYICLDDGLPDYVAFQTNSTATAQYTYLITDDNNNILGVPEFNFNNFENAPVGICRVWGLSYTGSLNDIAGTNATTATLATNCYELSSNYITINRNAVDGGSIAMPSGATYREICTGDNEADIVMFNTTSNATANYAYIITDKQNNILTNTSENNFDFSNAPTGTCRIWGLSYTGELNATAGNSVFSSAISTGCFQISSSAITIYREAVSGGNLVGLSGNVYNRVVIANRASGTISVINSDNNQVEETIEMPDDGEPMYVVYSAQYNTVLVGDYGGKVVAFDGQTFAVKGSAIAGDGVFHMWLSPDNQQLWVNNELDKTISVIHPNTLETLTTFSIPQDLLDLDFKPHDVIVMPNNAGAFVSMLGPLDEDYVVKYSATTFEETGRVAVGNDPHLSLTGVNDKLYVASQGSGEVKVLNRSDLSEVATINVPNAHGLGMNPSGSHLYVGNISEGGTNATYTVDLANNTLVGEAVDAPFSAPHNYAVTNSDKLFITHSGAANDQVSFYSLNPAPTLINSVTVGNNPFGLAAYTYEETFEETTICAGDNNSDAFAVRLDATEGSNSGWVITDPDLNILGLPPGPPFDLEGAGTGTCLIWHISYNGILEGAVVGANAADLQGCYSLSNPVTVTRHGVSGGEITTNDPTEICAGDGIGDPIEVEVNSTEGENAAWVITDPDLNILGLPPGPPFDLEGAGTGTCLIWHISYNGILEGAVVGANAADLQGCYSLSNPITVERYTEGGPCEDNLNKNIVNRLNNTFTNLTTFSIYPNPVRDRLNIAFSTDHPNEMNTSIRIIDLSGKTVMEHALSIQHSKISIDASRLMNGIYFVHYVNQHQTSIQKMVKQN